MPYLLPLWMQHPAVMNNPTMFPPPPPPPPDQPQQQRRIHHPSPRTALFDEPLGSNLPPPPPPPPPPPVISKGELRARVAAATAEAQLSELRAARSREIALLVQLNDSRQQHVRLLFAANTQQARMSTSQLQAADAAAERPAQLAHSAIQESWRLSWWQPAAWTILLANPRFAGLWARLGRRNWLLRPWRWSHRQV